MNDGTRGIPDGDERELGRMFARSVADDLRMLVRLHDREPDSGLIVALREVEFPRHLGLKLRSGEAGKAMALLAGALEEMGAKPEPSVLDALAVDYADIYLNHALRASPFESVWLDEDQLRSQQPMFEVRRWYERYRVAAPDWRKRSDDHLTLQLQFLALLEELTEEVNQYYPELLTNND